jgi:F-type H+-transporting ATPase subunit epsilon
MYLEIITPDTNIFAGEVVSATFPGKKGSFQVLKNHAAIISTLEAGTIKYKTAQGETSLEITGGVVEVLKDNIQVLVEGLKK